MKYKQNIYVPNNFLMQEKLKLGDILYVASNAIFFLRYNDINFKEAKFRSFILDFDNLFKYKNLREYTKGLLKEIKIRSDLITIFEELMERRFIYSEGKSQNNEIKEIGSKIINYQTANKIYNLTHYVLEFCIDNIISSDGFVKKFNILISKKVCLELSIDSYEIKETFCPAFALFSTYNNFYFEMGLEEDEETGEINTIINEISI